MRRRPRRGCQVHRPTRSTRPGRRLGQSAGHRLRRRPGRVELADFDCVFLCNVAQLTAGEAERLTRYAAAGGGVVIFLGDRVIPDQYNALAQRGRESVSTSDSVQSQTPPVEQESRPLSSGALLPARLGPITSTTIRPRSARLPASDRRPVPRPRAGRAADDAGRSLLSTRRARRTGPAWKSPPQCPAAIRSSSPRRSAAAARSSSRPTARSPPSTRPPASRGPPGPPGPASCRSSASCWPTQPAAGTTTGSNPSARRSAARCTGSDFFDWWLRQFANAPVEKSPDPFRPRHQSANRPPRRPHRPAQHPQHARAAGEWTYDKTDVSGIYTLRGATADAARQFAVNVDTAESDLTKADGDSLPPELLVRDTWQDGRRAPPAACRRARPGIDRCCGRALALLFVESFLAWQFGRGAA